MSASGARLTLLVGDPLPVPASPRVLEALDSVEVTSSDKGRSGFQLTFRTGRDRESLVDYGLLQNPLLRPGSRVVLVITVGALPEVLFDGIITNHQLAVGSAPGSTTLTLTGEDLSVKMDVEERSVEHPAQSEMVIATKIILGYAHLGLVPMVIPPPSFDMPVPTERIPVQQGTDLEYLTEMAGRFGYVFYIAPGPAPLMNTAYWGPPLRAGVPQRAISVNMGSATNILGDINFEYDDRSTTRVEGQIQDRRLNRTVPIRTFASTRLPLVRQPAWARVSGVRVQQMRESGLDTLQALVRAQGITDATSDETVSASGELDTTKYGGLLRPRGLVGLRGAGLSYDGLYYVRKVTHNIRLGQYRQRFQLRREGVGALAPVVIP